MFFSFERKFRLLLLFFFFFFANLLGNTNLKKTLSVWDALLIYFHFCSAYVQFFSVSTNNTIQEHLSKVSQAVMTIISYNSFIIYGMSTFSPKITLPLNRLFFLQLGAVLSQLKKIKIASMYQGPIQQNCLERK